MLSNDIKLRESDWYPTWPALYTVSMLLLHQNEAKRGTTTKKSHFIYVSLFDYRWFWLRATNSKYCMCVHVLTVSCLYLTMELIRTYLITPVELKSVPIIWLSLLPVEVWVHLTHNSIKELYCFPTLNTCMHAMVLYSQVEFLCFIAWFHCK